MPSGTSLEMPGALGEKAGGMGGTAEVSEELFAAVSDSPASGTATAFPGMNARVPRPGLQQGTPITHRLPDHTFLQATPYCDWPHPAIQALAGVLTEHCERETEKATRLFTWVRDTVAFAVGGWNQTASQTLAARAGTCSNKANLLVAAARVVGIPAGYYVLQVSGKDYLGPVVPARLRKYISARSTHVYATLWLNGRWVRCDPTDDLDFALSTVHVNPQSRPVTWDGEHDALLNLDPQHILAERGPLASVDDLLAKRPRIPAAVVHLGNLYVQFLRTHAAAFATPDALERGFRRWLRVHAPAAAVLYCLTAVRRGR